MQANVRTWCAAVGAILALAVGVVAQDPQSGDAGVQSNTEGDSSSLLTLKLKDRSLRDVVNSIRRKAGVNIIMDQAIEEDVTIDLEDVPWRQALGLVVEAAGCIVVDAGRNVLKVEKPPRVYFAFENADIQKVIDTIAKISGANIVVAPEVRGPITLRLKDIPWRDALDAAVKTLGFVVVEEDRGILRVVPASNIQQDLVTKAFQLRYVRPRSTYVPFMVSEYVINTQPIMQQQAGGAAGGAGTPGSAGDFKLRQVLERMLTPDIGKIEYFDDISTILVKDTKPVVDEIGRIIEQVDVEPAQIFLDVKFITTANEDILDYGISPGGNGWTASLGLGAIPHRLPFDLGPGGFDDSLILSDTGTGPFADPNLNAGATTIPNVVFGALSFTEVTAALRLLKRDSTSQIEQAPKIVALDHHIATIFVGEAVRYAQARVEQGQAGGLLLALEEGDDSPVNVGFQLLAIPHVVPGTDKVLLDVIPQRTSLTGTGASSLAPSGFDVFTVGTGGQEGQIALPRVSSSTIATKVMLHDNQTAVLGGLVSRTQTDTETKLPLLGDIPIIGHLFKNTVQNDTRSNLIVFITPHIIRSAEDTKSNMDRIIEERWKLRREIREQRDAIFGMTGAEGIDTEMGSGN